MIEALRALEKEIADVIAADLRAHPMKIETTNQRAERLAKRIASAILSARQEVGAVESVWMFRCAGSRDEWMPFVNEKHRLNTMRSPEWEVREFTSPAHTSDARDAARYRALKTHFQAKFHRATCDYWVIVGELKTDPRFIGEDGEQLTLDNALDAAIAAMRQEAE